MKHPKMDRAAFTAWLKSQPPDRVFSLWIERITESCPLAQFRRASRHHTHLVRVIFPAWARAFMAHVDRRGCTPDSTVTAAQCLTILREMPDG